MWERRLDELKKYISEGKSNSEIAKMYNCTPQAIASALFRLGLSKQEKLPEINWVNEKDTLEKLVNIDKLSDESIAEKYGVSASTIKRKREKLGIVRTVRTNGNSKIKNSDQDIINAVKNNTSIAGSLKSLGLEASSGNRTWIKGKILELNIDTSHHTGQGWSKGKKVGNQCTKKIELKDILVENSIYQTDRLKKRLIAEGYKPHKCECCGITEWNGKPTPLELHHKNGNPFDNRLENLEILCPNCHAQTDNYCGKNINKNKNNSSNKDP